METGLRTQGPVSHMDYQVSWDSVCWQDSSLRLDTQRFGTLLKRWVRFWTLLVSHHPCVML